MKIAHEKPQHLCTYCGRSFSFAMALQKHIGNRHDSQLLKPKECHVCGKSFKSQSHLSGHIKHAHGEFKWKCKLCNMAYTTKGTLIMHQYTHLNQRPYNCHLCQVGYYSVSYIKRHYRKVHGLGLTNEEIYKTCRRVFIDEGLVKQN